MDVANTLEMAELDLDDDIIVGINNGSHVDLFEIYKIAERKGPIEYNNVGSWSDTDGFVMSTAPKYYRRADLKVSSNNYDYIQIVHIEEFINHLVSLEIILGVDIIISYIKQTKESPMLIYLNNSRTASFYSFCFSDY